MGLIRKYYAWIIIGVVLLVELGAMFFVWGKQSEAKAARDNLEERRNSRDDLKRKTVGVDERIKIHNERKAFVQRDLGDCALFLWYQGQAIEGLFEDKALAAYEAYPWQAPRSFDVFKVEYQGVYNREVAKLEPLFEKVGTDPGALGLADAAGFAQATVQIGDIYALQKEWWVKKEIVEILGASHAVLQSITYGAAATPASVRRGPPVPVGAPVRGPAVLAEPIPIQMTFACDYSHLGEVLDALLRSRLCLRITAIQSIVRTVVAERTPAAPTPGAKEPGPKPKEKEKEADETAVAAASLAERRQFVAVTMTGEVPDINIEVQEVAFPKSVFGERAKVLGWLDRQLKLLEMRIKRFSTEEAGAAGGSRPEMGVAWITRELQKAEKAAAAEPGKPLVVEDELTLKREYIFADLKAATEWLSHRYDFELARLEAEQELWRRVRKIVAAGKGDEKAHLGVVEAPDAVVVTFRPLDHFDANQVFTIHFDAGAQAKLGIVVVKPQESREGVKRAAAAR